MTSSSEIEKLAWIEIRDRRILSTLSKGKDVYYIPGGKRIGSETDAETLLREIHEELTVRLDLASLKFEGVFVAQAHGKALGVLVRMVCYSATYEGQLQPSSEVQELVWLSYRDRHRVSPVDQIIFDWLRAENRIGE
jgi:8-oxo-dGTP pyrophosphatase MutT (NUDIX family)